MERKYLKEEELMWSNLRWFWCENKNKLHNPYSVFVLLSHLTKISRSAAETWNATSKSSYINKLKTRHPPFRSPSRSHTMFWLCENTSRKSKDVKEYFITERTFWHSSSKKFIKRKSSLSIYRAQIYSGLFI